MDQMKSDWMGNLSPWKTCIPITKLCIPGSHNSFTSTLDPNSTVANDQPPWLQAIGNTICVKRIVHNWSVNQSLSTTDQLNYGVRYFDIRIAQPGDDVIEPIRIVHGQYGDTIFSVLNEINDFLKAHKKEIVILDFNHFYNMSASRHSETMDSLVSIFGSRLCPAVYASEIKTLSLLDCWEQNYQLIIFYQKCNIIIPPQIWPGNYIRSPWPDTNDLDKMLCFLECALRHRNHILPDGGFFVTQGIRTVDAKTVLKKPCHTVKDFVCVPTTKDIVKWLNGRGTSLRPFMNIIMVDFVETDHFCKSVISLN